MDIIFDKSLYSKKAIKKTFEVYNEFADFTITENKEKIKVCLININNEVENEIKDEFCNYVLHLMNK